MYKKSVAIIVFADLIFLLFLGISGMVGSIIAGDILYILAFILPSLAVTVKMKVWGTRPLALKVKSESISSMLPLVFPTVTVIIAISMITSFILGAFGVKNETVIYSSFLENIIRHALLPAIFEEILFRYVPLSVLGGYSARQAVILSSVFFAVIHCNLFQIPYALIAGVIFAAVDLAYGSILPSLIMHFVNNAVSVISLYYKSDAVLLLCIGALTVISLVFIIIQRNGYFAKFKPVFADKCKQKVTYYPFLLIIPTLIMAILNLF